MVCKKNTGDLYWFGLRSALRPVREESFVLSCTEVPVVGVISECEREGGSPKSCGVSGESGCVRLCW
jgi:hypothetical protein